jgi:hypothetical protein
MPTGSYQRTTANCAARVAGLPRGEAHHDATLTAEIVIAARRARKTMGRRRPTFRELAEAAGVRLNAMQSAVTGTTWQHLDRIEPPVPPAPYAPRRAA